MQAFASVGTPAIHAALKWVISSLEAAMMQIAPLLLSAQLLLVADRPPQLDIEPACRAVERSGVNGRSGEACMNEENAARGALNDKWKNFNATQQAHCTGLVRMGGPPSYVELLTCLEMAEQAQKIPPGDRLRDTTGAAAKDTAIDRPAR